MIQLNPSGEVWKGILLRPPDGGRPYSKRLVYPFVVLRGAPPTSGNLLTIGFGKKHDGAAQRE